MPNLLQNYQISLLILNTLINPISHGLWYDIITRGRAIMAQPDFLLYNSAKSGTNTQNLFPDKIFDI